MGRQEMGTGYGQLRWVVLLLAVAVILPTVCLLWFMSQVVKNERLAVRQKLINVYQEQLVRTVKQTDDKWSKRCKLLETTVNPNAHPYQMFVTAIGGSFCDGLIIYDAAGKYLYPISSSDAENPAEPPRAFNDAWQLELVDREFARAAELYEQIASNADDYTRLTALIGKSRCLARLNMPDLAIETCRQAAFSPLQEQGNAAVLTLIGNAKLLILKYTAGNEKYGSLFEESLQGLTSMLYTPNKAGFSLPAEQNLFVAQKAVELLQQNPPRGDNNAQSALARLQKLISAEELSIRLAEYVHGNAAFHTWPTGTLRRLPAEKELVYGLIHKAPSVTFLAILSAKSVSSVLADYENSFVDSCVDYRILDDSGRLIAGIEQPEGEPFAADAVAKHFPGWKVELYFKGGDAFKKAASERITVYVWTGMLVISLILVCGAFAAKAIANQVKLNKLKNDFIATVSHELKTPLASMRVLVDTLLEGSYRNQQQVIEYLQLISTENVRLSRLIDNFLTFSRMERNKKAFSVVRADPAAIARAAADAVKTKFNGGRCKFVVDIAPNLPDVLADHDAIVTVLVNLLDNAYKYSYDDKHIELKVSAKNGGVEFSVCDNGVGLSRRSISKIFKRFYQVDQSLSRRAGGCGLGLSIAKFIVDAHNGSISVESKLNQGSIFIVRLPSR